MSAEEMLLNRRAELERELARESLQTQAAERKLRSRQSALTVAGLGTSLMFLIKRLSPYALPAGIGIGALSAVVNLKGNQEIQEARSKFNVTTAGTQRELALTDNQIAQLRNKELLDSHQSSNAAGGTP